MPSPKFKVASAVRLETRVGGIGNARWMTLLAAIAESRSITAAARSARLSYKAAWDAIDAMNNLAGKPVVRTSVGGKGGGGAILTSRGRQLLAAYRTVEAANASLVTDLNTRLGRDRSQLQVLGRMSLRTSARNQWAGTVVRIQHGAINDEIGIQLAGGDRVTAMITHESAENLGLKPGSEAFALVKSSAVIVACGPRGRLRLSARNQLSGTVARVTRGAVNSEIVLRLRGGKTVAAVITNSATDELGLAVGGKATAVFKASAVILGVG